MKAQRLPAYGREIATLLREGRRPLRGLILVTTQWSFVNGPFVTAVCPRDTPVTDLDFSFLRGQDVLVLVPADDAHIGEQLLACINGAAPKHAMLWTWSEASERDAA